MITLLTIKLFNETTFLIIDQFIISGLLVKLIWGSHDKYITKEEFEKFKIENSEAAKKNSDPVI